MTIVIYHRADFDGIFCREIAKKHFDSRRHEAEYIGWDYGDPIPDVSPDDKIYMLDISVDGLMNHPNLNWVDHHKSAIEKYPATIQGYRIDGVAACRLAWQYFGGVNNWGGDGIPKKQDFIDRNVSEPYAVRLAGEYDIWDRRDPNAELFQHGLKSKELTPRDWAMLLSMEIEEALQDTGMAVTNSELISSHLLQAGRSIQYAKTQEDAGIIQSYGFTVQWEGLTFLACNHARFNSHLFTAGIKPEHDALLGFNWDGKQWRVSLYHTPGKEQHDLSLIAVKHGGGGHRGACGCKLDALPFLK